MPVGVASVPLLDSPEPCENTDLGTSGLDPNLGSTTYWFWDSKQVVWLWADSAGLWVPFSSVMNQEWWQNGWWQRLSPWLGWQIKEMVFASCLRPGAQHQWAPTSSDVLHSLLSPLHVMVQWMEDTLQCDLLLTVSRFVSVALSSFHYSGFQKIVQLPKLVEWATFKISQVTQSIALQHCSSSSPPRNHPMRVF